MLPETRSGFKRLTWARSQGEKPNDAVLRSRAGRALGKFGDSEVVAEANRRYSTGDPSAISGPLRTPIFEVVARQSMSRLGNVCSTLAREEKKPLVRNALYKLLGGVRDNTLAQRALDLALTDEPGPTNGSQIIGAVAELQSRSRFRLRNSASRENGKPRGRIFAFTLSATPGSALRGSGDDRLA